MHVTNFVVGPVRSINIETNGHQSTHAERQGGLDQACCSKLWSLGLSLSPLLSCGYAFVHVRNSESEHPCCSHTLGNIHLAMYDRIPDAVVPACCPQPRNLSTSAHDN